MPVTVEDAQRRLADLRSVEQTTQQRLADLRTQAQAQVLSEDEETEQIRLQQRLSNLAPVLATAMREAQTAQVTADIDAAEYAWNVLVDQKRQAYARFVEALIPLREAFTALCGLHDAQVEVISRLPRPLQERLAFPETTTVMHRWATRMPIPTAWVSLLCQGPPLPGADVDQLKDVDPGTRALPAFLLNPYRQSEEA